jgi:hypothetical protein
MPAMFGFSFGKLVVLVGVLLAIWFGFKWVGKIEAERKERLKQAEREGRGEQTGGGGIFDRFKRKQSAKRDDGEVQEMVKDPKTGAYVPKDSLKDD